MVLFSLILLFSQYSIASPNSEAGEKVYLFPEIDGWSISGKIRTYTPEILYDYINGAAELYLIYGFRELWVAKYTNENQASIIVEIYFHQTPEYAFGIYSQERPLKDYYIDIGAQGYMISPILNFLTGNAYVKINSYSLKKNNQEVLLTFAEKLAANLGTQSSLPDILDYFPEEGKKKNSEKFVPKDFLGYEFLHFAFTADYIYDNIELTLFIIEGEDSTDCDDMLANFMEFTQYPPEKIEQNVHTLIDPYHGEIVLSRKGKYLWGVMGLDIKEKRIDYLSQIEKKLYTAKSAENSLGK